MDQNEKESQAALGDTIATNRALEIPPISSLPTLPEGYKPTETKVLQKSLRRIPEASRAEALSALEDCAQRGDKLKSDLGPDVPPAASAQALIDRLKALRNSKARLRAQLECYEELEDIAHHDTVLYLEAVRTEYEHFQKKRPHLSQEFPNFEAFFAERGEAVRRGKAEAQEKTPPPEK